MRFSGSLILLGVSAQVATAGAQVAAASHLALWSIPELPGVRTEAVGQLMNTTDFTTVNTTEWAVFLDQPPEVLAGWEAAKKDRMFSVLHDALVSGGGLAKRSDTTAAQANAHIQSLEDGYLTQVTANEADDKREKGCIDSTPCVLCVAAAATVATGAVSQCASTAFTSIKGVTPAAGPAAAIFYTPIVLAFVSCAAKPVAAALGASGGCVKTLGG
ncbi:hypothetical protein DM02DRAFT_615122 [Periconia macrospinosa]|uniref:Uncharacterized protein n=1 Tax=Periconia macrospinosa TaxID=97972 RepID=A0A2V1DN16_9PLEO|nr:hypothetical protein DM02DRAFT_615122 [Periconia macrospinosa]